MNTQKCYKDDFLHRQKQEGTERVDLGNYKKGDHTVQERNKQEERAGIQEKNITRKTFIDIEKQKVIERVDIDIEEKWEEKEYKYIQIKQMPRERTEKSLIIKGNRRRSETKH